jgi:hypothetical protein
MPKTSSNFDFRKPVSYDNAAKHAFHSHALRQLKLLANALGLAPGSFDLRSNPGGIAVSGEVTLHADRLYVQASQSSMGPGYGILFRTCRDRKDYCGGRNNFASLDLLNDTEALARRITEACHV